MPLEQTVLLFPCFVVLFATLSFWCGGHVAVWHWWSAVAMSVVFLLVRTNTSGARVFSSCTFLLLLALLWVCVHLTKDHLFGDALTCHLPATHLLADGWNPICVATPEAVRAAHGIEPWDMRLLHVLFMHKGVWIFNSAAYLFHQDPLSIATASDFYLLFIVALVVWNLFGDIRASIRILMVFLYWLLCISNGTHVDNVVAVSISLLMITMAYSVAEREFPWIRLSSLSFIALCAKASGLICLLLWIVYALVIIIRCHRRIVDRIWQILGMFILVVLAFGFVCATPYYTAYRDYGHPLYPTMTSDPSAHPQLNMSSDFDFSNDDFKAMGAVGLFINAYFSPQIVQWYYCKKFHVSHFRPFNKVWQSDCPTGIWTRMTVWATILLLLLFRKTRLVGFLAVLSMLVVPPKIFGQIRYVKWILGLEVVVICLFLENCFKLFELRMPRWNSRLLHCVFVFGLSAWIVRTLAFNVWIATLTLDLKSAISCFAPQKVYTNGYTPGIVAAIRRNLSIFDPESLQFERVYGKLSHVTINHYKLLARHFPSLLKAEIKPLVMSDVDKYGYSDELGVYLPEGVKLKTTLSKLTKNMTRGERYCYYPKYIVDTWCSYFSNL